MQSTATLVMDQPLAQVMICTFVTILKLISNHTAILEAHINFFLAVNKLRTFLLVSSNS
jgi:hypothetical protein